MAGMDIQGLLVESLERLDGMDIQGLLVESLERLDGMDIQGLLAESLENVDVVVPPTGGANVDFSGAALSRMDGFAGRSRNLPPGGLD